MAIEYTSIEDEESLRSSIKEDDSLREEYHWSPHPSWWQRQTLSNGIVSALLISVILSTNLLMAFVLRITYQGPAGTLTETSVFSPIHNRIKLPLVNKMIDRTAAPNASNPDHIYRLAPSPEVDAAWDRITDIGMFPISHEDIIKIQKDPDVSITPPESWGMGNDKHGNPNYFMEIDVFHQLHCLNAIRKGLVHNYDYYWGYEYGFVPKSNFERHMNHCIDILRQALMCHADVEAVVFNWRETQIFAYPDFGVHRTCKDWDALMEWTEANKMPDMIPRFRNFTKPEGVVQLAAPPDLPQEGVDGTVRVSPGHYVKPLTGLAGVEYCLGKHRNGTV